MTIPNTIIEAGAGTGKTYQVKELLNKGLKSGQFDIDNVAVITFTRQAATELKERVMQMLQEKSADGRLREQLKNLGNAHISTIHSFCESLLKSRPVEADIDPSFRILEDEDMEAFFAKVFDEWLIGKLADSSPDDLKLLCLDNEIPLYRNENSQFQRNDKSIYSMFAKVIEHRELDLFEPKALTKTLSERLSEFEIAAKEIISQANDKPKLAYKLEDYLVDFMSVPLEPPEDYPSEIGKLKYSPGASGGQDCDIKELRREWKKTCEQFIADVKYIALYPQIAECHRAFNRLAVDFREYYRETMRLEGVMDFNEILIKTEELLRTNKVAREYFKNKFKFIFVDEFQDTDPLQTHIVFFLAEKVGEFANRWEDVNLASNKLCVVGDPKQSIYRFRRADIEIYAKVAESIKRQGETIQLDKSYRSAGKVLDWINNFFAGHLVKPKNGDWQVDYQPITIAPMEQRQHAQNRDLGDKGEIIFAEPDIPAEELEQKYNIDKIRECEAKVTAKWIEQYSSNYGDYKDVLILYRNKTNMQATADRLEELGIPCEVVGGASFFGRQEVLDLNNFMRAVVDPLDSVSIFAALRGPFFCLNDAQLCEWKLQENYKHSFAYDYKLKEFNPNHPVTKALIKLNELHDLSDQITAHELLKQELTARKLLVSYRGLWQGERRTMNIIKALEFLKDYDNLPCRKAIDKLTEKITSGAEMADFSPHTGQKSAVRLMSIHKAKGLQSKIVYLADMTSAQSKANNTFIDNEHCTFYYDLAPSCMKDDKVEIPQLKELKELEQVKVDAEEVRLRYVAATRVVETLVINCKPAEIREKQDNTIFSPFYEKCKDSVKVDITFEESTSHEKSSQRIATLDFKQQWRDQQQKIETTVKESSKPSMNVVSPSLASAHNADAEFQITIVHDPIDYTSKFEPRLAPKVGTLVHKLLELQPVDVNKVATTLIHSEGVNITAEILVERYERIKDKTDKLCQDAINIMREVPIKYRDDSGIYYDGVIDLLIEKEDGWIVVDYKVLSTASTEHELKKRYQDQLEVYVKGLKKIGLNVKDCQLIT